MENKITSLSEAVDEILLSHSEGFSIVISGPTASGKTDLSLLVAVNNPAEIINADVGQFFKNFEIGTAKPAKEEQAIAAHHLFDILDTPNQISAARYRRLVEDKIREIKERKKMPLIVGGSLFYIKATLFKIKDISNKNHKNKEAKDFSWEDLKKIDEKRASQLHPNDTYRISRAIEIWNQTGIKPSAMKPQLDPISPMHIFFVSPKKEKLKSKIALRTNFMLHNKIKNKTWLDEVKKIIGTEWEPFLRKNLIGYPAILDWILKGEKRESLADLELQISKETFQYARRQLSFWRNLKKELSLHQGSNELGQKIRISEIEID